MSPSLTTDAVPSGVKLGSGPVGAVGEIKSGGGGPSRAQLDTLGAFL